MTLIFSHAHLNCAHSVLHTGAATRPGATVSRRLPGPGARAGCVRCAAHCQQAAVYDEEPLSLEGSHDLIFSRAHLNCAHSVLHTQVLQLGQEPLSLEGFLAQERGLDVSDAQHIANKLLYDATNEALTNVYRSANRIKVR